MSTGLAIGLALGTSCAWAAANVYVQRASLALGGLRAMWWGQVVGGAILGTAALALEGVPTLPGWGPLAMAGAGSAAGYYGMMRAYALGPVGAITPVLASWAVPATLLGVLLGKTPTALQALAGALVVLGAAGNGALARGGEWRGTRALGFGWAAIASLGFGTMMAGIGEMGNAVGPITVVPLCWAAQWVVLFPALVATPGTFRRPPTWRDVTIMALCESVGFVVYAVATTMAPPVVVSPPASLSSPITVAFATLFLGERTGAARWFFVAVAGLGCVLLGWS